MANSQENLQNTLYQIAAIFMKQFESGVEQSGSTSTASWRDLITTAQNNYDEVQKQARARNDSMLEQVKKVNQDVINKLKEAEAAYKDRMNSEYEKLIAIPKTVANLPQVQNLLQIVKKMLIDAFYLIMDPNSSDTIKKIQAFQSTSNNEISKFYTEFVNRLDTAFKDALQKINFI